MATAIDSVRSDQCGVCSEIGSQRVEPRVLPCGHSLCKPCHISDHSRIGHHRCPTCRISFDGDIKDLPAAESHEQIESASSDAVSTCRSCTDSGIEADLTGGAVPYCAQCKRTFCDIHIQLHKQLLPDHHTVTLEDFTNSRPNQQTFCRKHESYLLIVGCNLCRGLFCNMCLIVNPNYCFKSTAQEKVHSFEVVEKIISQTRNSLRVSVEKLEEKSREYGEIITLASQLRSKVENQNTQAINCLEQAKQAMIQSIADKFEILESQLQRNRSVLDQEIADYTVKIEKTKQQIEKTIDNLKQHADGCSEDELKMQIDDITVMVDEMLSWRQKNINCSLILALQIDDQCLTTPIHISLVSEPVSFQLPNSTLLEPGEAESSPVVNLDLLSHPTQPRPGAIRGPVLVTENAPAPPPPFTMHQTSLSILPERRQPRPGDLRRPAMVTQHASAAPPSLMLNQTPQSNSGQCIQPRSGANLSSAMVTKQPSLVNMSKTRPPKLDSITFVKSSILYDHFDQPPPMRYCSHEGMLYLLSEQRLLSCTQPLESGSGRQCQFVDSGEFIVAHQGIVYTKQTTGPQILRAYNVLNSTGDLAEYRDHSLAHRSHADLISSFAVSDDYFIFCKALWPRLLVVPHKDSNEPVREVPLKVEEGIFKCRYITAGPQGHVLIMCDRTHDLSQYDELLMLVKVSDGSVEWKYKCNRAPEFAQDYNKLPQPIMYRSGYCYFHYDKTTVQVIDVVAGQLLQSFRIPAVAEAQGFRILIISMRIIPYPDDGLLVISNLTRQHRTGHTLSTVKSELWRIKYRARGFLSNLR